MSVFSDSLTEKLIMGVAAAASLGAGGTILNNWYQNGQQDLLIERALALEPILERIERGVVKTGALVSAGSSTITHLQAEQERLRDEVTELEARLRKEENHGKGD